MFSLRDVFNNLLNIIKFWFAFQIDTIRWYLVVKCHEKLINYLRLIYQIWLNIASNDLIVFRIINFIIVKLLKLRASKFFIDDARFIKICIRTSAMFDTIVNSIIKENIANNIFSFDYIIFFCIFFSRTSNILSFVSTL